MRQCKNKKKTQETVNVCLMVKNPRAYVTPEPKWSP
jgi:hypothetical protein